MKLFFTVFALVWLTLLVSCSNDDVEDPVDCNSSSLSISLLSKTAVSICGASDGTISVTVTGGKAPYQISINGGTSGTATVFNGLPAGTHSILLKDADACERTLTVDIDDPTAGFTASAETVEDNQCLTDNGSITITVTGGVEPYMYKFGSGLYGTTNSFTGLKNGTYSIEVKDATDCPQVINAVVPRGETGISFNTDIKPILEANCIKSGCHNGDNGASRNWSVFANVKDKATGIKTQTGSGSMPPTGGLPQNQRDLIACWVEDGANEN